VLSKYDSIPAMALVTFWPQHSTFFPEKEVLLSLQWLAPVSRLRMLCTLKFYWETMNLREHNIVGAYQSNRLSNLGIGHGAIDAGGGYTYFNPATGHEFSGVLGFTYNFINPATQYQSGVDLHFDWGASQFLTKQIQVGLVGYA
jgi:hypothetical protein